MDPRPQPEETPKKPSPVPENQENDYEEHAWVDQKSIGNTHCDHGDIKESKTLETFRTKVLEFARESRMSPEHILLIERSLSDLFPDLHVPDHPPYARMIHKAITELDEAGGSTEEAISLFIRKEQNNLPWAHTTLLKHHLEKLCENGDVVVTSEKCYMLETACETYNPNQIEAFNPNQIVAFNSNQISASPIPSHSPYSSPSISSSSNSDYTPNAKRRKQKKTGPRYGKKRRSDRKKRESEKEFEINEEDHSEDTEEEEETEEYEDEYEEFHNTEEEVEATEIENRLIKYKGKQTHRAEGAKKNKTKEKSEFRDEHMRVVHGTHSRGTKLVRGRGRPLKFSKFKTYIGPKEAREELIETHNQVAEVPKGLKQKKRRGRPSKNIGETQEQLLDTHQVRPKQSSERCNPPKKIGTDTNIRPKEAKEAFNQAIDDLKRPREKRGRGRPPKNLVNETNIGQKEARGEVTVTDAHNQVDCMEKPKQKKGRGRPPKNSSAQMVVFDVQNQTTEDGMKLKQGRRWFRRKHERKEVDKYLDKLEMTVLQGMLERMAIRSCDGGEHDFGAVSPNFPCKSCEPMVEDKIKKEREQQIQSSMGGVELFDKHDRTKLPEKSQQLEDMEKLSWTPIQVLQESTKNETYSCNQLQLQAISFETHEYTTVKEMASSHVHQSECIGLGQGGPPGFEHVTVVAPLVVSNDQHLQQHIHTGKKQLVETEEETSTFMELLHSDYQYLFYDKDQPKKQSCGVSTKPYCTGGNDKNSDG